jgi:hypothetical protein
MLVGHQANFPVCPCVKMALHVSPLEHIILIPNQPVNAAYLAEKQQIPVL